jgi:dipeptidyl aminopeptidase/acylaminoacyl peptidase
MRGATALLATACLLLAACTAGPAADGDADAAVVESPAADAGDTGSGSRDSASPDPTPAPSVTAPTVEGTPRPVHPVSLPALMRRQYDGRGLRLGEIRVRTDAYVQRAVTYRSGELRISGIINIPDGPGPFPALVLGHGYIDPDVYVTGQGLRREQDWLARAGFVVLHTDYRNHAGSDDDPRADRRLRLDYAADMINAVLALRRSRLKRIDGDRIGLLGRSMGGGVVYNALVARPGLVDVAVVYAPVSSRAADNFNRWIRDDADRAGLSAAIIRRYGAPEKNRRFWRNASARPFFDRITEPLLIHHGTADESCPIRWSRASYRALRRADVQARLAVYPGEPHAFIAAWPESMRRTVRFLNRHLDG